MIQASSLAGGYKVDALCTTTPLAAGATFTSVWVPVEHVVGIRMFVYTDQNGTLVTEHSADGGVTVFRTSNQPYQNNRHEPLSFYPRGTHFRVKVVNPNIADQTFLQLETVFLNTAPPVTQSPYSAALGRTSLAAQTRAAVYDFQYDNYANVSPINQELHTTQRTSLMHDSFQQTTTLDSSNWTVSATGSATAAITNARLQLNTGTTANSTVKVTSTIRGHLIAGSLHTFRSNVRLTGDGDTNCTRRWGVYDDNNGFFFELDGTDVYAVTRYGGSDTRVSSADWNIISDFSLPDIVQFHILEIAYFPNNVFFIANGDIYHKITGDVGGLPASATLNLPGRFELINKNGNTVDNVMQVMDASQNRYGPDKVIPQMRNIAGAGTTTLRTEPGEFYRVVVNAGSGTNTATFYDSTTGSGTVIAAINVNKLQGDVEFGGQFNNGLTVVTTGSDTDITVIFS